MQPNSALSPTDDISVTQLIYTLWRGKWIIALFMMIAGALGVYQAFERSTPLYTASAVVVLENQPNNIVDLETVASGVSGDQASINTEVEVIRSRNLISKLVDELDLMNDPEFNATLRDAPSFSIGTIRRWLSGSQPSQPNAETIRQNVITAVRRKIVVTNIRTSFVFQITATSERPGKSARLANTLVELYIQDQIDVKFEATEQATVWLANRVTELKSDLEAAETAISDFASNSNLVSPEILEGLGVQIKDLRERATNLRQTIAQLQSQTNFDVSSGYDLIATLTNDRTLLQLAEQISSGNENAKQTFEDRLRTIQARTQNEIRNAENQLVSINALIAQLEEQEQTQSTELVQLQQLEREAEAAREIYSYFLTRLGETRVQQGIQQADSRLLSPAIRPKAPSAPRKSFIVFISLILGGLLGSAFVILRETRNTSVRTADELEELSGISVLGQIPMIPARKRANVLKYLIEKPNSAAAEAIRNLRTSVLLSNIDKKPQIIMSTSSMPSEGKTTQSLALTQNISSLDQKVLLIEGDIRRRVFSQYFDIKPEHGILSVLSDKIALKDAVKRVDDLGADVLFGEIGSMNAADVFSSESFKSLLEEARKHYDTIIIDTPPLLVVPDARVIGQSVDAIIYTVRWDHTTKAQVRQGLKMFAQVNLKVTGLVLGQIDAAGMKKYGYGDTYGSYGAYGSKYYNN
ncbi:polysaccharide biosynthesis tyrosine autokinase [Nereida sp. MMG025]|uniref:GumC family protein n=1 Tax=Nereida sp. MMG025 TaxID=2909981 RepID=UPI001F025620|nr:polysaccharide biosynthesis tyrosine autokinase [Nereida sp. MMG025]MCF6445734.1 polysaccharide biosynthesis tyrosine autokinase [Nereida sp. MMG025]